jgi:hypothetical protein
MSQERTLQHSLSRRRHKAIAGLGGLAATVVIGSALGRTEAQANSPTTVTTKPQITQDSRIAFEQVTESDRFAQDQVAINSFLERIGKTGSQEIIDRSPSVSPNGPYVETQFYRVDGFDMLLFTDTEGNKRVVEYHVSARAFDETPVAEPQTGTLSADQMEGLARNLIIEQAGLELSGLDTIEPKISFKKDRMFARWTDTEGIFGAVSNEDPGFARNSYAQVGISSGGEVFSYTNYLGVN